MAKIAVLGTGAWGTALANILLENHHQVAMWGINPNEVNYIKKRLNPKYFTTKKLVATPDLVTTDLLEILRFNPQYIILAVPSKYIISTIKSFIDDLKTKCVFVNVAKGLNPRNNNIWSISIKKIIKNKCKGLVTLIGPSFATEVFKNEPTMVNTVSSNLLLAKKVGILFNNHHFKCIEIDDEIGAEILGASKNVMAIALGVTYELHTSINTRAALLAQVTKEIARIVHFYGGRQETMMQFCGIGDIYLTCTDDHSRNFSFGKNIAKVGVTNALVGNTKTIEGYETTKILYEIVKQHHINAPVLIEIYKILFANKNPKFFVRNVIKKIIQ